VSASDLMHGKKAFYPERNRKETNKDQAAPYAATASETPAVSSVMEKIVSKAETIASVLSWFVIATQTIV
jgi:hypothetical protein